MYKVLIIDDEPLARLGLIETIDWNQYGFEVVGDADNATTAMDLYYRLNPNVIITDICMEPIDGLSLIENMKKISSELEFIVISGYNDFNYAQTAIKYGVSTYILKPIDNEDLISALVSLKNKLDTKKEIKKIISEYTNKQNESILLELLTSSDDIEEKYKLFASEGYVFPENKKYIVANLQINNISKDVDNPKELIKLLKDIAKKEFDLQSQYFLSTTIKSSRIVFVIFENNSKKLNWNKLLSIISNKFTEATKKTVSIGVSSIMYNISVLPKGYMQSSNALHFLKRADKNSILSYRPKVLITENKSSDFYTIKTEALLEAIILNQHEQARGLVDSYFERIKDLPSFNLDDVKNTIINVAAYIIGRYTKSPEMTELIFKRTVHPAKEIWNLETIDDVYVWISSFIDTLMKNKQIKDFSNYSSLTQKAITYIMLNFANNCDAKLVAEHLYVSTGHLMRQFKQETGKTFLEYVTEYRISIAITLLQSGNYRIYEVADKVGYTDTKHFGKVFKAITGKSPKELRS